MNENGTDKQENTVEVEASEVNVLVMRDELNKYKDIVIAQAEAGKCDGDCEKHHGGRVAVRVVDMRDGRDWGYFSYCETALETDRGRGFGFIYV